MRVIELRAQNIKNLTAIDIKPKDNNTIVLSGKNGVGKSAVLDAMFLALSGRKVNPVTVGMDRAEVQVELGDETVVYTVKRIWTQGGDNDRVEVYDEKGVKLGKPHTVLDALTGALAFDPLEFARMDPVKRSALLVDVFDLPQAEYLARQKDVYDERTLVNREVRRLDTVLKEKMATITNDKPGLESVDVTALMGELTAMLEENAMHDEWQRNLQERNREVENGRKRLEELKAEHQRVVDNMQAIKAKLATDVSRPYHDAEEIAQVKTQIANADRINEAQRVNTECRDMDATLDHKENEAKVLTQELKTLDNMWATKIRAAFNQVAIAGLTLTTKNELLLNDVNYDSLSTAEKLEIAIRIAMHLNPKLKIIYIREGSLLDREALERIQQHANGYQLWIERVSESPKLQITCE